MASRTPRGKNLLVGAVLCGAVGLIMAAPSMLIRHNEAQGRSGFNRMDKPLTGSQTQRGPFMNSGSRDAGPDPDWDMKRMVYLPNERRDQEDR